jgi:hypothetical protein
MKSFGQFITEVYQGRIGWVPPTPSSEHGEVVHQLQQHEETPFLPDWVHARLSQLNNPREFAKAVNNGTTKVYTRKNIEQTNNTGEQWSSVENDAKKRRAPTLYGSGKPVQRPIVLRNPKTNETHLISGHHRATYVTGVMKKPVEVHEIN